MSETKAVTPEYVEPARGYRSLWLFALLLAVGFGIDLGIDVHGAVAHLPGWIGAAVLLLGIDLLVIHAARATKSVQLDATRLWVGDDTVDRSLIESSAAAVDDELPVLGWRTGMPRGLNGVTLQLTDGRAIVVPTRHPQRLRTALGHDTSVVTDEPIDLDVRAATPADLERVPDIDARAEAVFRITGYELPPLDFDVDALGAAAAVLVVGAPAIGYVQIDEVDGAAHVAQLAVIPRQMRRGHGTRLLDAACRWAGEHGHRSVTLITYADVPWNAPWYARHGFTEVPATSAALQELRRAEQERGLDDVGRRVVMRKRLT
ncbi:GNAT family N-acetyltransferase [uncultured Jatrophihabitans sp.]|uniref:GNAT family N-acetyltransferase n=1 Tax=uncultured Jatrophihabitans sp. TaxID=1610747 RepID=UPI0035CA7CB0